MLSRVESVWENNWQQNVILACKSETDCAVNSAQNTENKLWGFQFQPSTCYPEDKRL